MRLTIMILLSLIPFTNISAQFEKRDSLVKLVSTAGKDSAAVKLYLEIGSLYEANDPAMALLYLRKAAQVSREIDYSPGNLKTMRI